MSDLRQILTILDPEERRRLLIQRGWELQRSESQTDAERDMCDWMVSRGWESDARN